LRLTHCPTCIRSASRWRRAGGSSCCRLGGGPVLPRLRARSNGFYFLVSYAGTYEQ
jgi:hypothetical protein